VQPLCFLRRRIVGSDAVESGHAALRTRRGRCLPCTPPSWKLPNGDSTPAVKSGLRPVPRLRNSNHRTLPLGAAPSGLDVYAVDSRQTPQQPQQPMPLRSECTGTSVTLCTGHVRYKSLTLLGLSFGLGLVLAFGSKYLTGRRGRGNVGIPTGFPKSVGRVGQAGFMAFHAFHTLSFPWPVLGNTYSKTTVSTEARFRQQEPLVPDSRLPCKSKSRENARPLARSGERALLGSGFFTAHVCLSAGGPCISAGPDIHLLSRALMSRHR
jgi:hypothetical protein